MYSANASAHYSEVWDPPEARTSAPVKRNPPRAKHPRVKVKPALSSAHVPSPKAPERPHQFNDIPRQLTPEGNVLRVGTGNKHVMLER
ncbi:hypothetical protein F3J17_04115 [Burkholderia sp. Ax-1719]|nr:hypothetical protein [Burkholderia sp. Ax-1719]NIE63052.1 hypothetical protein [Burkholderia sp. Ax-1719]